VKPKPERPKKPKPKSVESSLLNISDELLLGCVDYVSKKHNMSIDDTLSILERRFTGVRARALSLGADPFSLVGLPLELIEQIALGMSYDQIIHLCSWSRKFLSLCTERFWKKKAIHDYGERLPGLKGIRDLRKEFEDVLLDYITTLRAKYGLDGPAPKKKRIKVGKIFIGRGVRTWKKALEQLLLLVGWGQTYGPYGWKRKRSIPKNVYPHLNENKFWAKVEKSFVNSYGDIYRIEFPLCAAPCWHKAGKNEAHINIISEEGLIDLEINMDDMELDRIKRIAIKSGSDKVQIEYKSPRRKYTVKFNKDVIFREGGCYENLTYEYFSRIEGTKEAMRIIGQLYNVLAKEYLFVKRKQFLSYKMCGEMEFGTFRRKLCNFLRNLLDWGKIMLRAYYARRKLGVNDLESVKLVWNKSWNDIMDSTQVFIDMKNPEVWQ